MVTTPDAPIQGQSPLLSLPTEILSMILRHHYRPWSLYFLGQYRIAEQDPEFECRGDSNTLCDAIPSRSILLVCRQMYKLALPLFHGSFCGKLKASLAYGWNWQPFRKRYVSLLGRVRTLEMDVSHINPVLSKRGHEVPSIGVDLPKLEKILMHDKFRTANLIAHLNSQEIDTSTLNSEERYMKLEAKQDRRIVEEIIRKRFDMTGMFWYAASVIRGIPEDHPCPVFKIEYKCQFSDENLPGIYEIHWQMSGPDSKVIQERILDADEEVAWSPNVEVLDMEARVQDCLLM